MLISASAGVYLFDLDGNLLHTFSPPPSVGEFGAALAAVGGDKVFITAAFSDKEPAAPRGGGFGGPGGGGPGGFGGPPQPGQILPAFLRDRLNLTAEQKKQLEKSQKDVDEKVGKVLTDEQKKQLQQPAGGFGRGFFMEASFPSSPNDDEGRW